MHLLSQCTTVVIILLSVPRLVHSLFQRERSTECDLLLSLSIYSILSCIVADLNTNIHLAYFMASFKFFTPSGI
jgi:hypothetical protein